MNTKLHLISVLAAGLTLHGAAMPTEAEVEKAVPKVERMLASEKVALESGKMTRAEVAAAAMKLAAETDDEAAKLLLMKGAFILHVKDGDLEKAVKTMNALETAIADMPPQVVTNIIETALLGLPNKAANGARLYRLLDAGSVKRKGSYQNRVQKALAPKRCFVTKEEIWRLLSSAQLRQKIAVPQRDAPEELPVFTNPAEARRKAKELGLWMFVYNMPCSRSDTFSSSPYFLKSLSKHCVFVHVKGFGSESAECPWERSTCWPCCRILDSDGNLISSVAKWSGMPNCEVSGQKMIEIFNGFIKACEIMPAAFDVVERNPNEIGLAKLHEALSSLPESFVNIAYLKWAELLVKADRSDERGWRACYSYADKILPLQEEFYRSDDCSFNNSYWRAKRDKEKYHDFLSGIDRVVLERRISASDDIRKRISAIDEQSLSDEARDRLTYLRQEVEKSYERLSDIQKDLLALEKWPEQKGNVPAIGAKPRVADGDGSEVIDGYTWSYRVKNGEAEVVAEKDGKFVCAVSPRPKGSVVIPEALGGATVRIIGQNAFRDCGGLTSILIPSAVTSIRENAFYGCLGLNVLTIPPAVREIGNEAFESCRELAAVTLPSSVVRVGRGIFADCTGLKQIDVEEGNPNYTSVDGVLYTKDRTELCMWPAGQRRVTIPDHVRVIGQWAFLNFDGLKSLTIPSTVTSIGWGAFQGCDGLVSVTIPSSVGSIDGCAFRECGGLTSVTMEEGVTNIGRAAFCDCSELKSVVLPSALTRLDSNVFRGCRGLTAVTIPPNVTSIGWCAFCDCSGLKSVTIPSSVTSIGGCAFFRCGELASVTIPRNVTSIGKDAFYGCGYLSSVTMLGGRPNSPDNVFPKCANLKEIHVPANAKSWAGMTEWQGIPLVFDGGLQGQEAQAAKDAERLEQEKVQREAERAEQRAQLLAIQEEVKRVREAKAAMKDSSPAVRAAVESILKGMIKVPGRDYWLSATEVTQEQWEPIMEFNLSQHKGAKLPVECVSRDDCDVFLEKLNQTKEVLSSGFEFRLPELEEWKYAAWAGSAGNGSWIKPGMIGNVLDMAWVKENSSNETHAVAMKAANAFGFYDMLGNVWEWLAGDAPGGRGALKGCAFSQVADKCTWNQNLYLSKIQRVPLCGLRLAAHKKDFLWRPLLGGLRRPDSSNNGQLGDSLRARRLQQQQEAQKAIRQEKVDGYTWSFRVQNGEAEIVSENSGKFACAVSPTPTGNITIPSTLGGSKVTSIGREALKECDKISSVTMPLTLTRVGRDAFNGCRRLKSLEMPTNVRDIGDGAFGGCCGLTSVMIPKNAVRVGSAVFARCTGLKQINVEEGNPNYTSVDGVLCTKDRSVLVMWPFGRVEVTIPAEVKVLGQWSFFDFDGLKTITIPSTVTRIGWGAFHGCDGLTSVTIPSSVRDIDGCAFRECGELEAVTIPEGVTNIAYCAFYCCCKLASVTIPSSVRSIGVVAFEQCALTSVTIPSGVETLGDGAFKGCGRLATVKISDGLTSISKEAFKGCGALTSLTIPESVRSIEQAAFYECGNLTSVTLPQDLRTIGGNAFMCCTKLKPVTIPASVTNVGGAAFAYCPEIKEHNLAADNQSLISVDGVLYTKDGKELVACPSGKTSVNILESVTNILSGSITGCGALKSLTIPSNVGIIGSWALSGSGATSIILPQGLPCIEDCLFWGCGNLTEVMIPDSVTSIGGNAFRWCGKLTSVTIPKGVKSIGGEAFYDCGGLTSITMCGERPDAPNNVFKGCRNLKSIHVPANAKSWAGMKEWQGIPLVFDGQ